jgi:hypothetical protein
MRRLKMPHQPSKHLAQKLDDLEYSIQGYETLVEELKRSNYALMAQNKHKDARIEFLLDDVKRLKQLNCSHYKLK